MSIDQPTLGVCMIVKNESEMLPRCLASVRDMADQIVVVDTGSQDNTPQIAAQFGAEVFRFDWCDDFSKARNFSLTKMKTNWILVLDADECIEDEEKEALRALIQKDEFDAYRLTFRTFSNHASHLEWKAADPKHTQAYGAKGWFPMTKTMLFRNKKNILFEGVVHETVEGSIAQLGLKTGVTTVSPLHFGYLKDRPEKDEFYIKLGYEKIKKNSEVAQNYFELGVHLVMKGNLRRAEILFKQTLKRNPGYFRARLELANIYTDLGQLGRAIWQLRAAIRQGASDPILYNNLGNCYFRQAKFKKAEGCFKKAVKLDPGYVKALKNWGLAAVKQQKWDQALQLFEQARHHHADATIWLDLGYVWTQKQEFDKALTHYKKAESLDPDDPKIILNLANTYTRLANREQAANYFQKLVDQDPTNAVAKHNVEVLRSQA